MALADLKIAVTGAASRTGQAVRTILADENHVRPDNVRLLEHGSDEAIISEYAGQATLIGGLEPDAIADRDLVFLCGSAAESAGCLLWQRKRGSLFVDLSGVAALRGDAPVVNLAVDASALGGPTFGGGEVSGPPAAVPETVAAPHPLSYALSTLLAAIDRAAGVVSTVAVVHRPAADFGEVGLEELHKQTVSLLSFGEVPKVTYGRQIAFNLVPQTVLDDSGGEEPGLDDRVSSEVRRILRWPASRAAVRILVAPVFHGHTGLVHVRPARKVSIREIMGVLKELEGVTVTGSMRAAPTPVEIAERPEFMVVTVAPDGGEESGFWIWLAGGDLPAHAARNAVEIAARVFSE